MNGRSFVSVMALAVVWGVATNAGPVLQTKAAPVEPQYLQVAGLFGESDEEKAARLAAEKRENDQDAAIQDLKQRVQDLERALEISTGQNEQLQRRVIETKATVDKLQKELDYRLCSVTAQLMGAGGSTEAGGFSCDGKTAVSTGAPQGGAGAASAAGKAYDDGLKLLARGQYDEAQASLRSFIDANPKDDLVPQALYLVGNISYLKRDYAGAAETYVEGIKRFSKNAKAPEFMIKLGQSLIALGQKKEGCLTLASVKTKYPKASAGILAQASNLHAQSCK